MKSLAQLLLESEQSDAVCEDLCRVKAMLVDLLESVYRAPVHCFEHGSAADGSRILCTVDHAHLHLLPTSAEVLSLILGKPGWEQVQPDLMEVARQMGRREYLYYESPDGMAVVTSSTSGFESQYMRRVFASALGTPSEWNWRSNPRAEAADNLFRTISMKLTPSSARAVVRP